MADALHLTFVKKCDFGLVAETKWISFSVARDLIKAGFAVECNPAPKQVEAQAMPSDVTFRMLATGDVYTMPREIADAIIGRGDAELA
jgi:hypothetical protein